MWFVGRHHQEKALLSVLLQEAERVIGTAMPESKLGL